MPSIPEHRAPERRTHDGRPVITRAEFIAELGIGRSTAEQWYRDRGHNGHPEPVLTEGRRMFWDEHALMEFGRAQLTPRAVPARILHDGRALITRAEAARVLALAESTLHALYARRAENGHPEPVHRDGATLYFDEADMLTFARQWNATKTATLTRVDRGGDPDELVDLPEAARVLGFTNPNTITGYRSRNAGYFPDPDATEPLRWTRASLWSFADRRSRPGRAGLPQTDAP